MCKPKVLVERKSQSKHDDAKLIFGIISLFTALRVLAHFLWERKPFRRYTNWNLISYALVVLNLLWTKKSLFAQFIITNSIAICVSFYVGVFLLDFDMVVEWARIELKDFASDPAVTILDAEDHLLAAISESQNGSWIPFQWSFQQILPELRDGINHPLEYVAAFHIGSFFVHVVPAYFAWKLFRDKCSIQATWWITGGLSAMFHLAWAFSIAGGIYLDKVYFVAPKFVWQCCFVSAVLTHFGVAYALSGSKASEKTSPLSSDLIPEKEVMSKTKKGASSGVRKRKIQKTSRRKRKR